VALALVNLALAYLIVRLAGFSVVGPPLSIALLILAVGVLAAIGAVAQWRKYLKRT
jgi:biopolymer transport protein ExbB/TolQ